MQFNEATYNTGICQDIDFLCLTNTSSYPLKDKARNCNRWYRQALVWIWDACKDWDFDDGQQTDLPIATTTIVNNQQDYSLPTTALRIRRVEVLDSEGDYRIIEPIDEDEIEEALTEFRETAGLPQFYRLVGSSVFLYPKPDTAEVTAAAGLKFYFDRDIVELKYTNTDEEPGFAAPFHRILSYGAAYDYEQDLTKKSFFKAQIAELKEELVNFYSGRDRSYKSRIEPHRDTYE